MLIVRLTRISMMTDIKAWHESTYVCVPCRLLHNRPFRTAETYRRNTISATKRTAVVEVHPYLHQKRSSGNPTTTTTVHRKREITHTHQDYSFFGSESVLCLQRLLLELQSIAQHPCCFSRNPLLERGPYHGPNEKDIRNRTRLITRGRRRKAYSD